LGAELATPYSLASGNQMTSKDTGETLQVANSDFCVVNGITMMRNADGACPTGVDEGATPMATVSAEFAGGMSSDLSDEFFASLLYVQLPSPSGNLVKMNVDSFMRDFSDDSVRLMGTSGFVHIKAESYSCTDAPNAAFSMFNDSGYVVGSFYHLDDASDVVEDSVRLLTTHRRMRAARARKSRRLQASVDDDSQGSERELASGSENGSPESGSGSESEEESGGDMEFNTFMATHPPLY